MNMVQYTYNPVKGEICLDKLRIFIVEDDQLVTSGLSLIINAQDDMEVWGTASNGQEALTLLKSGRPDAVLLDLKMPVMDGITLIREIRKTDATLPILVLTMYLEDDYIIDALSYGANGYLIKHSDNHQLLRSIREVVGHHFILPWEVASRIINKTIKQKAYLPRQQLLGYFHQNDTYSLKEQEIIIHMLNRLTNKEIAEKMFLSEGTIKNNITRIYKKLNVRKRSEAIKKIKTLLMDKATSDES